MKRIQIVIIILLLMSVYVTAAAEEDILSPGMSRQDVIEIMGQPGSSKIEGDEEVLEYSFTVTLREGRRRQVFIPYRIILKDGKVIKYGWL